MEDLDSLLWHLPSLPDEIDGNAEVGIIDSCIDTENESLQGKIVDEEYIRGCQQKIEHANRSHAKRDSLEIYSKLSLVDAQKKYNEIIGNFPV